jgi:MarR family transcriptional regulator for hemolysin
MSQLRALQMKVSTSVPIAGRHWMRLIEHALSNHEISGACAIPLLLIGRSGGGIHQVALAEQVGVMGPSMVRLLDRLCAAGLVRREQDSSDRRAKTLWLTDTGDVLAGQLEQRLDRLRHEVLRGLSKSDLEAALRVNETLANAVGRLDHDASRRRRSAP